VLTFIHLVTINKIVVDIFKITVWFLWSIALHRQPASVLSSSSLVAKYRLPSERNVTPDKKTRVRKVKNEK
jgi:hypothetical protein